MDVARTCILESIVDVDGLKTFVQSGYNDGRAIAMRLYDFECNWFGGV